VAGVDGNLWFPEAGADQIGRITTEQPPSHAPRMQVLTVKRPKSAPRVVDR
jgi:hypothetical protein